MCNRSSRNPEVELKASITSDQVSSERDSMESHHKRTTRGPWWSYLAPLRYVLLPIKYMAIIGIVRLWRTLKHSWVNWTHKKNLKTFLVGGCNVQLKSVKTCCSQSQSWDTCTNKELEVIWSWLLSLRKFLLNTIPHQPWFSTAADLSVRIELTGLTRRM